MSNTELMHHGTKGMRWGIRRYQNKDGSLTAAGRKRYGEDGDGSKSKGSFKERMAAKKKAKETAARNKARVEAMQRGKEAKKKQAEEEAKQQAANEAKKKEVLESRSAKAIYENAHLFTNEELNAAYSRLTLERNIAQLAPKEVSKGEQFVDKMISIGKRANDVMDVGGKFYNNVAKIHNSLSDKDDKWPLIGEGNKEEKSSGGAFDLNKAYKNVDKMSDDDLKRAAQRAENRSKVTKAWEEEQKRGFKSYDNSNPKDNKTDDNASGKKDKTANNQHSDNKDKTESKSEQKDKTDGKAKGEKAQKWEKTEKTVYTGTVEGKGTSTSNIKNGSDWFNSKDWEDVPYAFYRDANAIVPVQNTGQTWIAGYLEDFSRR